MIQNYVVFARYVDSFRLLATQSDSSPSVTRYIERKPTLANAERESDGSATYASLSKSMAAATRIKSDIRGIWRHSETLQHPHILMAGPHTTCSSTNCSAFFVYDRCVCLREDQKRGNESRTRTLEPVEAGAKAEAEARSERAATVFIGTVLFLNKQRVGT